jgi:hypothetical protein
LPLFSALPPLPKRITGTLPRRITLLKHQAQ